MKQQRNKNVDINLSVHDSLLGTLKTKRLENQII
jgi:hypothetical protein